MLFPLKGKGYQKYELKKESYIIKFHCSDFQLENPVIFNWKSYGYSLISDNMVDYMSRETFSLIKTKMPDRIYFSFFL